MNAYRNTLIGLVFGLPIVLSGCAQQSASYFGQNQVQYDRFDFQVMKTEHFDIFFYEEAREATEEAGRMAERWYARLSRLLNHDFNERQPLILYASHPHFQQTNTLGGTPGEGIGGATEVLKRRIVLPLAGPLKESDHVIGHEIVHAFQFDMTSKGGDVSLENIPRALGLPLWFVEGMAEYLSIGANDPHTAMWIRDAAANDRLPNMEQLSNRRYFPYRFGQAFWAYVAGRWGDEVIGRILNAAGRSLDAEAAFEQILLIPPDTVNAEWHEAIQLQYGSVRERSLPTGEYSELLLSRDNSGRLNTSPALSPDGREITFLSERDRFSIDIFRADAETGELLNKVVETASDPHLESVMFLKSAGAWAAQGARFAFAGIANRDPVLRIVDVNSGETIQERTFPDIGEVSNPSWSPDGQYIAFSAIVGGVSDLFIYDTQADSLRRMTNDLYADLQPAWSPDGQRVAFVTDRFTTDLSRLDYGDYRLALMNPATGEIGALSTFPSGKNINPQWSESGESLYFLANPNGITNVHRAELATGKVYQITDLYTGVTGITALSPALSSAQNADKVAFSVYERGWYSIYMVDDPHVLEGTPVVY